MRMFILVTLTFAVCFGQPPGSQGSRGVAGRVQAEDGSGIPGAVVTLNRKMEPGNANFRRLAIDQKAQPDGSFAFYGLGPGLYVLCSRVANSTWLDPCEWGKNAPRVKLGDDQTMTSVVVSMKKGVALPVRVDDPGQLLSTHEGKTPGAHLLIGVSNDAGVFHTAALVTKDGSGRSHQILIPVDTPVNVVVYSGFFQLTNDKGGLIGASATSIPVVVPSGQQPNPVTVRVVGTNPH